MWFSGEKLLKYIGDVYFYEGVLTGFSIKINLEEVQMFGYFPEVDGLSRGANIPYIQHPLGEIELLINE